MPKSAAPKTSPVPPANKARKPASAAPAKGRPRRCTWDEVLVAAEHVMQQEGYKSLSMRALADELGIAHPSLYTYVQHIEEVEVAVLQVIDAGTAGLGDPQAGGRQQPGERGGAR